MGDASLSINYMGVLRLAFETSKRLASEPPCLIYFIFMYTYMLNNNCPNYTHAEKMCKSQGLSFLKK